MDSSPKTFLFDLNGTVIDDMHYHAKAWYQVLNNDLNANLTWDEVKVQMYGKNGEVLARIFGEEHFSEEEVEKLSEEKERHYQEAFRPHLKLINGLDSFLEKAKEHNIQMAIASAAIPSNIDFVLDNLDVRHYFNAIVSAADVTRSKPDPETFIKAAQKLGAEPAECIVFEDAPKGVEAAQNAGMQCVVITTAHPEEDFSQYNNVITFIKDYTDSYIEDYFLQEAGK
ncbi:HAD family hydrolase [Pontibacter silvestris]|uniref:Beta-phosphoglucomutase n=1 Tax=Pontibacter silvestris TaxID=2305183 RepID=A0ABW4X3B5_9BACT|nr:HAD family phosphatase [Pontibacter silvestris]